MTRQEQAPAGPVGQRLYVCSNDESTREGTLTGESFHGSHTISTAPDVPGWENDGAYPGYGLSWEWAAFLVDAANSYSKACGPRAVECAEADLLGQALATLRQIAAHTDHGDNVPATVNTLARAILAKASGATP